MSRWQKTVRTLAPYRPYFWKFRHRYLIGAVALMLTSALQLTIPQIVQRIIERVQAGVSVGSLVVWIAVVSVALFGIRIVSRMFLLNTSRMLEYDLLDVVYQKLQRLPMSFYLRQHTGDLMSRASNDVRLIRSLSGFGVLSLANLVFFLVLALGFMSSIDVGLTVMALLPFGALLLVVRTLGGRLRLATVRTQEALARLSSLLQETLSGMPVVQAYRMEAVSLERFAKENDAYRAAALEQTRARSVMIPFMSFASGVAMLLVLALGGRRVAAGGMGFGEFVAFYAYMGMLIAPTVMLGWTLSLFQRGLAAFERLTELLGAPETLGSPNGASKTSLSEAPLRGGVAARDLGFRYLAAPGSKERRPAIRGVTFQLEPGGFLGIVGPVGSGKTTLLRCIVRHLEVEPGQLFYDDVCATLRQLEAVRRPIGFVPQDDFLFSASIAENIAFGRPEASQAEIVAAARLAKVDEEIARFPEGYKTVVGERGLSLSGGQRQRVALARALLIRPRILVLDDALSKVDADTAVQILESLRTSTGGVTMIVASHRVSSVQAAGEILVLEEGRVSARGSHEDLLQRSDYYKDMAWRQTLESEVEALD